MIEPNEIYSNKEIDKVKCFLSCSHLFQITIGFTISADLLSFDLDFENTGINPLKEILLKKDKIDI